MKRKRNIQKFDNIVVFPGTSEMLLRDAQHYAENFQYHLAVEKFEEAFRLVEGTEQTLSMYAFALYEIKQFKRAKSACEKLLELGPTNYFEAMELYLTICMQLKEFEQVNKIIESLLEEDLVPEERIAKFERLKNLNAEIAENKRLQEDAEQHNESIEFSSKHFLSLCPNEQLIIVNELTAQNIRPIADELKTILEHEQTHVFIKSLILILLVEQAVSMNVKVEKFNKEKIIDPSSYPLPTQLQMYKSILQLAFAELEKEPSTQELVQHLVTKHAIVAYPFEWEPFEAEDVAKGYILYVKMMFGEVVETDNKCIELLQLYERLSDI